MSVNSSMDTNRRRRRQSSASSRRPPPPPPPPSLPPPVVFNPLWICCLCCPPECQARINAAFDKCFDACVDHAATLLGHMIGFVCGPFLFYLGPGVVAIALGIVAILSYTFFTIILPMLVMAEAVASADVNGAEVVPLSVSKEEGVVWFHTNKVAAVLVLHVSIVLYILVNVLFHYGMCVMVRNNDVCYHRVLRQLASATGYRYPETPTEVEECKQEYGQRMMERASKRRLQDEEQQVQGQLDQDESRGRLPPRNNDETSLHSSNLARRRSNHVTVSTTSQTTRLSNINGDAALKTTASKGEEEARRRNRHGRPPKIAAWMLLGPYEWGFCLKSNQPKPPRSHYDHVTKCLVLNMDHYCPWTFSTIGYFNYRYFCSFLCHVVLGLLYGLIVGYTPFWNCSGELYEQQIESSRVEGHVKTRHMIPLVPTPDERNMVWYSYILLILTFMGVAYVFGFHLHLILTGQTTIEQRGNAARQKEWEASGRKGCWTNPYSLGWKRNLRLVFGSGHPLLAILVPSTREPEFLPVPIDGELIRRNDIERRGGTRTIMPRTRLSSRSASCTVV